MNEQCKAEDPGSPGNNQEGVKSDGPIGMQGMKPDTAAVGVEDWMGQEVVQVNDNPEKQYQHCFQPVARIKKDPDDNRDQKVNSVMEDLSKRPMEVPGP